MPFGPKNLTISFTGKNVTQFSRRIQVEIFKDDDRGYLRWLQRYPNGYVLNTYRPVKSDYMILHRTTCPTISGTPARGENWTVGYQKICAQTDIELINWADEEYGQPPKHHQCTRNDTQVAFATQAVR